MKENALVGKVYKNGGSPKCTAGIKVVNMNRYGRLEEKRRKVWEEKWKKWKSSEGC